MSDEESRPDGDEAKSGAASSDIATSDTAVSEGAEATQQGSVDSGADEAGAQAASTTEQGAAGADADPAQEHLDHAEGASHQKAAFAATVLGDTLPSAVRSALEAGGHGHGAPASADHGHAGGHDDEHFAHALPMTILGGVLVALVVLTVLTVAVTSVDLGSQGNFIVAMIIATIKAALVMGYFMHLVWDSKFNVFVFLSSFFFVILFLSTALLDRQEYQHSIDTFEADQKATAK